MGSSLDALVRLVGRVTIVGDAANGRVFVGYGTGRGEADHPQGFGCTHGLYAESIDGAAGVLLESAQKSLETAKG